MKKDWEKIEEESQSVAQKGLHGLFISPFLYAQECEILWHSSLGFFVVLGNSVSLGSMIALPLDGVVVRDKLIPHIKQDPSSWDIHDKRLWEDFLRVIGGG